MTNGLANRWSWALLTFVAYGLSAHINPKPTAEMFDSLEDLEGQQYVWLSSHPASGGRAKAFRASYRPDATYRPALSVEDEDALFGACNWRFVRYHGDDTD